MNTRAAKTKPKVSLPLQTTLLRAIQQRKTTISTLQTSYMERRWRVRCVWQPFPLFSILLLPFGIRSGLRISGREDHPHSSNRKHFAMKHSAKRPFRREKSKGRMKKACAT